MRRFADEFAAPRAVGEDFRDAVTDETDGRVSREPIYDRGKLVRSPPIVTVQKGDDFALAFGNGVVECAALPPIGFAQDADLRCEFAERTVEGLRLARTSLRQRTANSAIVDVRVGR